MAEGSPTAIVLAGCNGAGKTTAARTLLADALHVTTYVNADVIAQGLSGFNPESAAFEAGRIMLERLHRLAEQRASFAFETTLAGKAYARWLTQLRRRGYVVHLAYFWLDSADLAVARVAQRVRTGGHNIPETTVRQRYRRSVLNCFRLYRPIVNSWEVYDNSKEGMPTLVAHGNDQRIEPIVVSPAWEQLRRGINE